MTLRLPPRYQPGPLLGKGGMGAVYRVYDTHLAMDVALKLVRPDLPKGADAYESLQMESWAAARLCHPHIVPLYDAGRFEGFPYLAMKYIPGGSLALWRKELPPWPPLARFFQEILSALSFVHARGLLHRDIKPENILLDQSAGALLTDLGLVVEQGSLEYQKAPEKTVVGTPAYMAPEQFTGDPRDLGPHTDLYAVGVMLFELLSGKRPFPAKNPLQIFRQKSDGAPPFRPRQGYHAPEGLGEILQKLLAPVPEERYPLAADVLSDLAAKGEKRGERKEKREGGDEQGVPSEAPRETLFCSPPLFSLFSPLFSHSDDPPAEEASRASLALFALRDPGLAGREEEKALLFRLAEEAFATQTPRLALIEGPAGIGKSRLVRWLKESLERQGRARMLLCREEDETFGGLLGLAGAAHRLMRTYRLSFDKALPRIARYLGERGAAPSAEAEALCSWLYPQKGDEPLDPREKDALFFGLLRHEAGACSSAPDRARQRETAPARKAERRGVPGGTSRSSNAADGGVSRDSATERGARTGPTRRGGVLVCFENVAAASPSEGLATLSRLFDIVSRLGLRLPVLFLATARPEDWASSPEAARHKERLLERPETTLLRLSGLRDEGLRSLILDRAPIEDDLLGLLAERSEGTPLYAIDLLQHWIRSNLLAASGPGDLQEGPVRYRLREGVIPDEALPRSIDAAIEARVSTALRRAKEPSLASSALSLAALLGLEHPREALLTALSLALDEEAGEAGLSFLLGEGFLQKTQQPEILRFSHRLLRTKLAARAEARPDATALHRACAMALEGSATDPETTGAAASHWEKANEPLLAARGFLRAGMRWRLSDPLRAEAPLLAAERLAATLEGEEAASLHAAALLGRGHIARTRGRYPEARALFEAALAATPDRVLHAEALCGLSGILLHQKEQERAEDYAREAARLAREERDREVLSYTLLQLGILVRTRGDLEGAARYLGAALDEARAVRARQNEMLALRHLAMLTLDRGSPEEAEGLLRQADALAGRLGAASSRVTLQNDFGELARSRGALDEARAAYLQAREESARLGIIGGVLVADLNLALCAALGGQPTLAREHLSRMEPLFPQGRYFLRAPWLLLRALTEALSGAPEEAARLFVESRAEGIEAEPETDGARIAERLGDAATGALAKDAYALALTIYERLGHPEDAARVKEKA